MRNRSAENAGNISIYELSIKNSGRVRIAEICSQSLNLRALWAFSFFVGDGMGMFPLRFFETLYLGMAKANFYYSIMPVRYLYAFMLIVLLTKTGIIMHLGIGFVHVSCLHMDNEIESR